MSRDEYEFSRRAVAEDWPFYGIIMAAMRRADTDNLNRLRLAFPDTFRELQARYDAPGGALPPGDDGPAAA